MARPLSMPVLVLLVLASLALATWVYPLTSAFEPLSAGARAADRASIVLLAGVVLFLARVAASLRRAPDDRSLEGSRRIPGRFASLAAALLVVLGGLGLGLPAVLGPEETEDPVVVEVVGRQFVWYARYPGADGKLGTARLDLVDPVFNPVGIDPDDASGDDDIVIHDQVLRLPNGRPARVRLRALDVIHGLYLPAFRAQRDAIPGRTGELLLRPIAQGRSDLFCAELCGLGHYRMRGAVEVLSPESFRGWLDAASARGR